MDWVEKLQIRSPRTRKLIALFLIGLSTKYLSLLIAMHLISPGGWQPFEVFAVTITAGLACVLLVKRLSWLLVLAAVAFPAQPFFGNLFLFMDSMSRRSVEYPFLQNLLDHIQGWSFLAAAACMLLWIIGLVGGVSASIRDYRAGGGIAR